MKEGVTCVKSEIKNMMPQKIVKQKEVVKKP